MIPSSAFLDQITTTVTACKGLKSQISIISLYIRTFQLHSTRIEGICLFPSNGVTLVALKEVN